MIDFGHIGDIDAIWIDKSTRHINRYKLADNNVVHSTDKMSLQFTLCEIDDPEDIVNITMRHSSNQFKFMADCYDDPETEYELKAYRCDDELVLYIEDIEDDGEIIYFHLHISAPVIPEEIPDGLISKNSSALPSTCELIANRNHHTITPKKMQHRRQVKRITKSSRPLALQHGNRHQNLNDLQISINHLTLASQAMWEFIKTHHPNLTDDILRRKIQECSTALLACPNPNCRKPIGAGSLVKKCIYCHLN